jgi:hypothetical protein
MKYLFVKTGLQKYVLRLLTETSGKYNTICMKHTAMLPVSESFNEGDIFKFISVLKCCRDAMTVLSFLVDPEDGNRRFK